MSDDIITFLAVVGAITGVISLAWKILDERIKTELTINMFDTYESEDDKGIIYFDVDFDVRNLSKKPNTIRDVHLLIPKHDIRLGPNKYEDMPIPGLEEKTIPVVAGPYRPIFDLPIGETINKTFTFRLRRDLVRKIAGEEIEIYLVLSDTYGKTIKEKVHPLQRLLCSSSKF
ncbi:MAG: hypothetical protein HY930_06350 [Euryarchaeota archaeon]|nr:hypothetical protein [Euryarchaeota archaeon]